jgi:FkbM family methyltransferase
MVIAQPGIMGRKASAKGTLSLWGLVNKMSMSANKFFQKAARRLGIFKFINFTGSATIGGRRFRVPVIREMGLGNLATTEPWMMELIQYLYKEKTGAFVDIGANTGQTLLKFKSVAPLEDYIGFEPNPACVYYLRELIKANHFQHSIVVPVGCFDTDSVLELLYMGLSEVNGAASMIKNYRPNNKIYDKQYVPVFSFAHLQDMLNLPKIAIIKIDVEGSELEVLQGLRETLKVQRPHLLVEILPAYHDQNIVRVERQKQIEQFLRELDYSIVRVKKTAAEGLESLLPLDTIGIHSDLRQCDYVFSPNIKEGKA